MEHEGAVHSGKPSEETKEAVFQWVPLEDGLQRPARGVGNPNESHNFREDGDQRPSRLSVYVGVEIHKKY